MALMFDNPKMENPSMQNRWWGEVCERQFRPHAFHASYSAKAPDRSTPLSSQQAMLQPTFGLIHEVERIAGPDPAKQMRIARAASMATAARERKKNDQIRRVVMREELLNPRTMFPAGGSQKGAYA
eukprot:NODE_17502_length_939_cov_4.350985.p2 GENE.NODE_17502_length_939_cov_4.350985~~NODE_17502_length_939_cov_4.350985.p2  ORF type:complete len:147 (-),score=36.13 NODE_17502_length_939_cov_4.350985:498-875(-)